MSASLDGSLLDDPTWRARHRSIQLCGSGLALFCLVFSLTDTSRPEEWVYTAITILTALAALAPALPRRMREMLLAICLATAQLYVTRFVGNFTLGPLSMIVLSFYQDWLPVAVGCLATIGVLVLAWVHPAAFAHSAALRAETPEIGMTLRTSAILLAAVLALAIWRSGTQLARDQLTGMLSRLGGERIIEREIERGRRPAVWICDIDNFRLVNRQLGAETGDLLLRHVARRLRRAATTLPGGAITARLGGDTFMIAQRDSDGPDGVEAFAKRIEGEVGTADGVAGYSVPVRLSVGAAIAEPEESASHLVRAAIRNMQSAKGRGTARVVVDRGNDHAVDDTRSLLTSELYEACERGELELYVQPIVALADGTPVGGETLARWNHPQRGLIYPGEFLPEAEQDSALMAVISNTLGLVFHDIVADFAKRYGPNWLPYGLSYNLSAVRLRDPTLTATLVSDFERTSFMGTDGRVNVEVTEGALMDVGRTVPEALAAFRAAGYCVALDDFGTGHSSLAHLRDFPLDTVKLDMSFVQAMDRSPIDRAIVEAVVEIASVSRLTVVAEGVETTQQRDMLMAIKPDMLAQGWLYAKAMPLAEFESWVLERRRSEVA